MIRRRKLNKSRAIQKMNEAIEKSEDRIIYLLAYKESLMFEK